VERVIQKFRLSRCLFPLCISLLCDPIFCPSFCSSNYPMQGFHKLLFKYLHFRYDNCEHDLAFLVIEHLERFFSPPLQFILPVNIASLLPDGGAFLTIDLCLS
jgi:hypothetical protein